MDLRQLTAELAVSPQIDPEDLQQLAQLGFTAVIDNRPDSEIGESHQSHRMAASAADAGLAFHYLPIEPGGLGPAQVRQLREIISATDGKVLAYCRSGTRSVMAWALGQAGDQSASEIIEAAAQAGFDLSHITPLLRGD